MKTLVWGIHYAPETSGISPRTTALGEYLARRGHEVTLLTTFPFFPAWEKRPEDAEELWRTESINGVKVVRVWTYVPARPTLLRRLVHEIAFAGFSFVQGLGLGEFDVAVVISPPLGLGFFAWLFSRIKGTPVVFHVQELQPDEALSRHTLEPGVFSEILSRLEAFTYAKAARVSGVSPGMVAAFRRKSVPPEKIILFPNGVVLPAREHLPPPGAFRDRHGIGQEYCLAIGSVEGGARPVLDIFLAVAPKLIDHAIKIVLCGEGLRGSSLERLASERKLKNLLLLSLPDDLAYRQMQVDTSVSVLTLPKGAGRYSLPGELLAAALRAKPVLAVAEAESELARAVVDAQCGRVVAPGDVDGLAAALIELSSPARQFELGHNGRKWAAPYAYDIVHATFEEQLTQLAAAHE